MTKANSNMLSKVGITIGTDNKLSIDETSFKKADMNTVKIPVPYDRRIWLSDLGSGRYDRELCEE